MSLGRILQDVVVGAGLSEIVLNRALLLVCGKRSKGQAAFSVFQVQTCVLLSHAAWRSLQPYEMKRIVMSKR